ncbi:11649_t:CDS:2 [Funneliformis geosporum]|nr:11649_t:CDS:2 [Funneliformis geosporum]
MNKAKVTSMNKLMIPCTYTTSNGRHSAVAVSTKSSAVFSVAGELFIGMSLMQIICSEIEWSFPNAIVQNSTASTSNSQSSTSNSTSSEESRKRSEILIQAFDQTNKKDKAPIHKNNEDEDQQNSFQSNESNNDIINIKKNS